MADQNVTFDIPEGYAPPEQLDSDNTFEAMCTLQLLSNDQLKLIDVEGYEVAEEEGETEEEPEEGGSPGTQKNMSEDRTPAGTPPDQTGGYAQRLVQRPGLFRGGR